MTTYHVPTMSALQENAALALSREHRLAGYWLMPVVNTVLWGSPPLAMREANKFQLSSTTPLNLHDDDPRVRAALSEIEHIPVEARTPYQRRFLTGRSWH